jgi:hypothetical protein
MQLVFVIQQKKDNLMQVGKEECQFPLFFEFSARVSEIFQKKDAITTVKHVENVQKFKKFKIENVNVACVTLLIESVRLQCFLKR